MDNGAAPQDFTVLPTLLVDPELRRYVHASFPSEHDIRLRHDVGRREGRLNNINCQIRWKRPLNVH